MGRDLAFYLDTFGEVYQQAYFYAGGFQVVNELGAVGRMEVFDGFQFEDDFVFNEDIGSVFSNQLVIIVACFQVFWHKKQEKCYPMRCIIDIVAER